jgi:two-component system sensor histidine kinase MtrB
MLDRIAALPAHLAARWRQSLRFRVVLGTVAGSTLVLVLLLAALLGNVSAGVLGAKESSALAEATAARSEAQRILDATPARADGVPVSRTIDAVVAATAARGAQAGLFDVLMLSSEPAGLSATPERGTNLVSETSVPPEMRAIVSGSQRQAWTYTTIRYTDGREVPGFIVGAPLAVRGVGPYELYQLFPLQAEEETLVLVRNATAGAGILIVLGLAGLAALVTFMIVAPVHEAARTARRFSSGHLEARMRVRGEDDLAQLAVSFNEMAGTLQLQIDELEKLSSVQRQFVGDVSHELRTPLTTVRMAADLLHDKRDELPPDDARAVELLQNQLNRFEALLADLLETSRQDAGGVQLDYEDVDLRQMAERTVAALEPLATEIGSPVAVRGLSSLVIPCDAKRVERILSNLVSNALEHGQGQPVVVEVNLEGDEAQVAVTDQGVGLSQEALSQVFTRFWRADPSRVRRLGGTGLGLSIALGDARAHGGTLSASGAPGQGATFTLRLPVAPEGVVVA